MGVTTPALPLHAGRKSYTVAGMKTAISLPDRSAERFDRVARQHGMTRSEFYRRAAELYADALDGGDLTEQIDAAIGDAGQPGADAAELRRAANARLVEGSPEW